MVEHPTFATISDVEADLLRPLTQTERVSADRFLTRALDAIEDALGELPDQSLNPKQARRVRDVQAQVVARRFRSGAEGFVSEGDGQYTYRADMSMRSGRIRLTDDDLADLGISTGSMWVWNPDYGG